MSQKKIRWVLGTVFGLVMIGVLGWEWWLPRYTHETIRSELADRVGMECDVRSVGFGLRSLTLSQVRLQSPGRALLLRIDELRLKASLWDLVSDGAAAIEEIELHGARVEARTHLPGAGRSFARIRRLGESRNAGTAGGSSSQERGRRIAVYNALVRLSDAQGEVVSLDGLEMTYWGGSLRATFEAGTFGADSSESVMVTGFEARVRREGGSWRLGELRAPRVRLSVQERGSLAAGLIGDDAEGSTATGELRQRLRRAVEVMSPRAEGPSPAPGLDSGRTSTRYLGPGFVGHFPSVQAIAINPEGESRSLAELSARVEHIRPGRLRISGQGTAAGAGEADWDLDLDPQSYEAVGRVGIRGLPLVIALPFLPDLPWYRPERTLVSASLTLRDSSRDHFAVEGSIDVSRLGFSSPRLASAPVDDISVSLRGVGTWVPRERRLHLERGQVRLGDARVDLAGRFAWPDERYTIEMQATLPPTSCQAVITAPPADLLQEVQGFELSGTLAGSASLALNSEDLDGTELRIETQDRCVFHRVPPIADLLRVRGPFRHRVLEPDGSTFAMTTGPGTGRWVSRSGISPYFVAALLTREDGRFFRHGGFSVDSIRDALVRNLKEGRFVYGASTITMQLVKNLFLQREKTLARKAQEVFLTWMLEHLLSKDEIITLYANVVEYGNALYGLRPAARRYFGRSASGLSPAEATFLASILTRPKTYHGQLYRGELSESMRARMGRVLRRMGARGRISPEEMEAGLAELPGFQFHPNAGRPSWVLPGSDAESAAQDEEVLPGDADPARPATPPAPDFDDGSWEPGPEDLGAPPVQF